ILTVTKSVPPRATVRLPHHNVGGGAAMAPLESGGNAGGRAGRLALLDSSATAAVDPPAPVRITSRAHEIADIEAHLINEFPFRLGQNRLRPDGVRQVSSAHGSTTK